MNVNLLNKLVVFLIFLYSTTIVQPMITTASSDISVVIKPGPLTLETASESPTFTLNRKKGIAFGKAGTLVVTDATGSGSGWHITVDGSPVVETKANGSSTTLPIGSFRLHNDGTRITSNGGIFPHLFDSNYLVMDSGKPSTVLTAYKDEGMGQFHISFPDDSLRIYLPNYNETSTYSFSFTWSVVQGP